MQICYTVKSFLYIMQALFFVKIHPEYLSCDGLCMCKTVVHNWDSGSGKWSVTMLFEITITNHAIAVIKIRISIFNSCNLFISHLGKHCIQFFQKVPNLLSLTNYIKEHKGIKVNPPLVNNYQ